MATVKIIKNGHTVIFPIDDNENLNIKTQHVSSDSEDTVFDLKYNMKPGDKLTIEVVR